MKCRYCGSENIEAVKYKDIERLPWYMREAVCMRCGYHGLIPPKTWEKLNKRSGNNESQNKTNN